MARHGLEDRIQPAIPGRRAPAVRRDAADLVVGHPARDVIEHRRAVMGEPVHGLGWALQPRKTRSTPTWHVDAGGAGVDVLGCNRRPSPTQATRGDNTSSTPRRQAVAPPKRQSAAVVRRHRMERPEGLSAALKPVLRGGRTDCATVWRREACEEGAAARRHPRRLWRRVRPPNKPRHWGDQTYGRRVGARRHVTPRGRGKRVARHTDRPIRRPVQVQARRSPDAGAEVDWSTRPGHEPGVSTRVSTRLKRQAGQGRHGGDDLTIGAVRAVDHIIPRAAGGREAYTTWPVWHRYGHVEKTARERRRCA